MAAYRVTAGCVVARTLDGGESYYDRGAVLPDTVSGEEKDRLVEIGLVEVDSEDSIEISDAPIGDEPPRAGKGSGRTEWAAYAAALGIQVDPADTRDDIIAAVDAA